MMNASDRKTWLDQLLRVVDMPLVVLAERRGMADMPIEGKGPREKLDFKPVALLEIIGRIAFGVAPWLESDEAGEREARERTIRQLAAAIESVLDPSSPDYCDVRRNAQALVDLAFLAQGLLRSPRALAGALNDEARGRMAETCRVICAQHVPGQNNWLLFAACCQALLRAWDEPHQPTIIDYAIRKHADWYLGDGLYGDGPPLHWDYYNSYVIQPMMLDILQVDESRGATPPWFQAISPDLARRRLSRWAAVQERLIAVDGSYPVLGRSMAYRSGAFQGLAMAAWLGLLPAAVSPAQVRCALAAVHHKTLGNPASYTPDGWLQIGIAGHQPSVGEGYISTASLYLTTGSFLPLGLPADAPFWADPDAPWTACRVWAGEDLPCDHAIHD